MFVLTAIVASGAAAALVASFTGAFEKAERVRWRWAGAAALAASAALSLLPLHWGWISLLLFAFNLSLGLVLRHRLRSAAAADSAPPPLGEAASPPRPAAPMRPRPAGDFFQMVWGSFAGALSAAYVGGTLGIAYLLVLDHFVSTWIPSLTGRAGIVASLIGFFVQFALAGAVAGAVFGWRRPRLRATEIAAALVGMVATFFAAHLVTTALIDIPAFQEARLLETADPALIAAKGGLWLLRLAATVLGALTGAAVASGADEAPRPRVVLAGLTALALTPWTIGLYAGRLSYDAMLGGMLLEKSGHPETARRAYALGLTQHPDDESSSYLQFRIAMVERRLGHDASAKEALRRLVTRNDKRRKLVGLADQYLEAWERAPKGARRVVLPGVETATEFKAGYCVPNSLSLVMRYWGAGDSAQAIGRSITMLDLGTGIEDSVWYVERRGLRHFLLPMSSVSDLKGLIDEGIPALVYIPQHVLAVIGYDEAFDSLVAYDVAQEEIWIDHPISNLLPEWKGEKAVISVVMSEERFQRLGAERRRRLESATAGYLHFLLHLPYHHSPDAADARKALAHLERAVREDPAGFYAAAHVFSRSQWGEGPRRRLAESLALAPLFRRGLGFMSHDFDDEETLQETVTSALGVGLRREVVLFLEHRLRAGTLADHDDLVETLGALQIAEGRPRDAASTLGHDAYGERGRLLARALEGEGAVPAAVDQYRRLLGANDDDDDDAREPGRPWFLPEPPHRPQRDPKDHALRRDALLRLRALRAPGAFTDGDLRAADAFSARYPWDAEGQAFYAEAAADRLAARSAAGEKRALRRRLRLAVRLAAAEDPGGEPARRAAAALKRAGDDGPPSER